MLLCGAFFGRFPPPPQAEQLVRELNNLGIRLKVVKINAGGDIDHEVETLA